MCNAFKLSGPAGQIQFIVVRLMTPRKTLSNCPKHKLWRNTKVNHAKIAHKRSTHLFHFLKIYTQIGEHLQNDNCTHIWVRT